jgi:hypothetical protein
MKPAIKKLRTCTYSKDRVPSAAIFGTREQHTNKLVCDHPEMKLDWNEKVCGPCTVYQNRNAGMVIPAAPPVEPELHPPAAVVASSPAQPPSPTVTEPPPAPFPATEQAVTPPKIVPKPTGKTRLAKAPQAPRGETAAKTTTPAKTTKAPAETRARGASKPASKSAEETRKKAGAKTTTTSKRK